MSSHLMKISQFANLSGISRKNLIFYDEIGLLPPERIDDNGYRLYSYRQVEICSVIWALREIGMPLAEIKNYLDQRTPDRLIELFTQQRENVDQKIEKLHKIRRMIDTRIRITQQAREIDIDAVTIRRCEKELLFVSDPLGDLDEIEIEKASNDFYNLSIEEQIIYGYPLGAILTRDKFLCKRWKQPTRFFFKLPPKDNHQPEFYKPAGLYLIAYGISSYNPPEEIYNKIYDYIEQHNLTIAGDCYEEYILDEISIRDQDQYLLQISVPLNLT